MLIVPVTVQDQRMTAIVDTAAEITFISHDVFKSLNTTLPILREVVMNTACRNM